MPRRYIRALILAFARALNSVQVEPGVACRGLRPRLLGVTAGRADPGVRSAAPAAVVLEASVAGRLGVG